MSLVTLSIGLSLALAAFLARLALSGLLRTLPRAR